MKNTKINGTKKRGFFAIALVVMAIIPIYAQQYDSEKDFQIDWDENVKNGVEILKYIGTKKEVRIPPKIQNYPVTSIGPEAFKDYTNLTSITIPDSVTRIVVAPFVDCINLAEINVAANNPNYSSEQGVLYNKNKTTLYRYPPKKTGNTFNIPKSVTNINLYAFAYCTNLTSITIPNGVTDIDWGVFAECTSLTNITIPKGVTVIVDFTFTGCTSLTSVTIPNTVTYICDFAFSDCTSLTSITIPDSVTAIAACTFSNCTSLTSIIIPNSVESIDQGAFEDCTILTSITLPDSVTYIRQEAFKNCTSLTSVTIQGKIPSENFDVNNAFPGDLREKYFAKDGGPGTYRRFAGGTTWRKQ